MMRAALCALALALSAAPAAAEDGPAGHLRLIDRLDRPVDGYCLDVLGVGRAPRADLPIFAHNCKSRLTPDSAVALTAAGRIKFVALDLCVTAFGVNGATLPGAPILTRGCGARERFFDTAPLQAFSLRADGRVVLAGSDLCLAAGAEADETYSPNDRWRMLTVARCDAVPPARARWEFVADF